MKKINLLILSLLVFLFSCKDDDDKTYTGEEIQISEIVNALYDNSSELDSKNFITYTVTGKLFEHEQHIPTLPNPMVSNNYTYAFSCEMNADKIRKAYSRHDVNHPAYYPSAGGLYIINGNQGTISGVSKWLAYYFGDVTPHSMFSSELYSHLKSHLMTNPLELVREYLKDGSLEDRTTNLTFEVKTYVEGLNIIVTIDPTTKLPVNAKIMEEDNLKGDVEFEVVYENWQTVNGIKFPGAIKNYLGGEILQEESFTNIEIHNELNQNVFELEQVSNQLAFDPELARQGIVYSQFYRRWDAWNIPWPEPVDNGAIDLGAHDLSQYNLAPQYVSQNIKIIGRPDNRLWATAIKTSDNKVYIIDSPLNQRWTRSIINSAKLAFGVNEIEAFIMTHAHHDHFGGVREAAFESDKIYIDELVKSDVNDALAKTFSLDPDNYQNAPNASLSVIGVNQPVVYLDNGNIEIHRLKPTNSTATAHAEGMVFVYIPSERVLIQSDQIWNGTFMMVWNGFSLNPYTEPAKIEQANNAKYLLDYINEKGLMVEKIVAAHGGLGPFQDLVSMASY